MLKIEFINEDDSVYFTKHADDRRLMRDGQVVGLSRKRVEDIVLNNLHRLKPFHGRASKFVLMNYKDGLNIVGELLKRGDDWVFEVITVMFKRNFKPSPGFYAIRVNENESVMMFESFMEAQDLLLEIGSGEGDLFRYEQTEFGDEEGNHSWTIDIDEDGIEDKIYLNIQYFKDPTTPHEVEGWTSIFEDVLDCFGFIDVDDKKAMARFKSKFDTRKWSKLIDVAEVSMTSESSHYEPTKHGKKIALKLLRTRFNIIRDWVAKYRPDVFMSKPKKESNTDNRRLRIYEAYFRKSLPDYRIFTKDTSNEKPWFSTDTIVCVNRRLKGNVINSIEDDVDSTLY